MLVTPDTIKYKCDYCKKEYYEDRLIVEIEIGKFCFGNTTPHRHYSGKSVLYHFCDNNKCAIKWLKDELSSRETR